MKEETQLNPQTASLLQIKQVLAECELRVPAQDMWRLSYPAQLLDTRHGIELKLRDIKELNQTVTYLDVMTNLSLFRESCICARPRTKLIGYK